MHHVFPGAERRRRQSDLLFTREGACDRSEMSRLFIVRLSHRVSPCDDSCEHSDHSQVPIGDRGRAAFSPLLSPLILIDSPDSDFGTDVALISTLALES